VTGPHPWSSVWTLEDALPRYRIQLDKGLLGAAWAPLEWQDAGAATLQDPTSAAILLPLYGISLLPRLFPLRMSMTRRRLRFGVRAEPILDIASFVAVARATRGSQLMTAGRLPVSILHSSRPPEALHSLRNELNEALFVLRYSVAEEHGVSPYRD